jgi:palmitoyltransferase ZDHHC9/14/18
VGHRNYTSFFAFLTSTVLTSALVIVTSAIHIAHLAHEERSNGLGRGFVHALSRGAGSAVVFSLTILMIWPITALALYHVRLLLLNVTTIEQVRIHSHTIPILSSCALSMWSYTAAMRSTCSNSVLTKKNPRSGTRRIRRSCRGRHHPTRSRMDLGGEIC